MSHPRFLFLAAPVVAAAALLFAAGAAEAGGGGHGGGGGGGHGGGGGGHGGGGGGHGGAVHVGGVHGGAVNHNGFNNRGFGFGVGIGLGYPYYGYGGYGYGGYGGYGSDYYPPTYAAPAASYYVTPPTPSVYNVADPNAMGGAPAAQDPVAHVLVKVPADADVWFGQGKTRQTGAQREFVSPALTPGKDFTYEIKARWTQDGKEVVQTRQIDVSAGAWKTVDFTKPVPEQLEPPKPKN